MRPWFTVAAMTCTCGEQIRWEGQPRTTTPVSGRVFEWVLVASHDVTGGPVFERTQVALCLTCRRLWIAWGDKPVISEYLQVDPDK